MNGNGLRAIILGISSLIFTCHVIDASAEGVLNNVRVTKVRVDISGKGVVFFDGTIGGTPPGCVSAAYTNALAFDTNTPGGRGILALVLSAKATDTVLSIYGTGACAIYGNAYVEDWNYNF